MRDFPERFLYVERSRNTASPRVGADFRFAILSKSVEKNRTILRKVNTPETLTNDKGQMTNDSLLLSETLREHQLALFAPTNLVTSKL
ncbi:hypothetical protein LC653_00905 [Nostoc sp. CHAB 5784]|uniref:hypothetical protein n=1 Tax=Nostoc mirabile TaxID=2907820 RepID=UPI001E335D28|nr:hypothetical protein [Nostoc mirabile]MCC5662526.1 hypothetical protein [Nostoc mirabile CHAB5784]